MEMCILITFRREYMYRQLTWNLHDFHSFTLHISRNKFHSLLLNLTDICWINLNVKWNQNTKVSNVIIGGLSDKNAEMPRTLNSRKLYKLQDFFTYLQFETGFEFM